MRRVINQDAYERASRANLAGDVSLRLSVEDERKRQEADRQRMLQFAALISGKPKGNPS
ncbi:hypothetical protein [Vogesella indigofera]|uniref:Uncharacterized protein n=1 Tax=Vogesella indigofera TaxID=45465 RepID=A0ABT5I8N1_VOGIN|nr:hypothetical protein [Vogesella indigofera]MDC7692525.1 hypothetical protein [Vogesella indigofera]